MTERLGAKFKLGHYPKLRHAREDFARVNELQKVQRYYFKFLSSRSYDLFFKAVRDGTYKNFKSELEAKLEE